MTTNGDFFDDNGQAGALKAGLLGFGGSGKTYTAILLAKIFGRPSWAFVETLNSRTLREGRDQIAIELGLAEPPPRVSRDPETGAAPAAGDAREPFEGFAAPADPTLRSGSGWGPITDRKGGDWSEWSAQLRVRQVPEVPHA